MSYAMLNVRESAYPYGGHSLKSMVPLWKKMTVLFYICIIYFPLSRWSHFALSHILQARYVTGSSYCKEPLIAYIFPSL